jgi:hypothetical protein
MFRHESISRGLPAALLVLLASPAAAQSFRVQCPPFTITHPDPTNAGINNSEPAYTGPTYPASATPPGTAVDYTTGRKGPVNGAIKCQQISGGDGYSTMGDGTQTYMFSFGPLSGLTDIALGKPGTEPPNVFNTRFPVSAANVLAPGDPATTVGAATVPLTAAQLTALASFQNTYNGAVGLDWGIANTFTIYNISESTTLNGNNTYTVTVVLNAQSPFGMGDQIVIGQGGGTDLNGYVGTFPVTAVNVSNPIFPPNFAFQYQLPNTSATSGLAAVLESPDGTASSAPALDGHVDPRQIMDVGVMNGNIPAPLMAIDEDDEFFLTLTNVGMIMRPDLFEQHTVHFHGYPNASAFYDGVPDASVAINIGGSFTYYYLAPDAGTYFWHCHITPPEHLQMGMVGQLYVRPRQNRWAGDLYAGLQTQQRDLRTACRRPNDGASPSVAGVPDILCSNPVPAVSTGASGGGRYAYNDGDGSTYYDVEYPLQMHGFDPNFHFVGMTFNPEGFADMKDKYFLLNGRSYPDTVTPGPLQTQSADGVNHFSQPLSAIVSIPAGQRALLRISNLDVSEYQTLASLGVPMQVVGYNAKLLRDQAGNNLYYATNSITLAGGESLDAILDTCLARSNPADPSSSCTTPMPKGTYYLYTPNLDHLSNDAENFGGLMTEVRVN